jgi:hypothetical protein
VYLNEMKWGNTCLFVASTEEQGTEHLHEPCGASVEKPKSRNPDQDDDHSEEWGFYILLVGYTIVYFM